MGCQRQEVTTPMERLRRLILSEYLVLLLSVMYFGCLAPFTPGFASADNLGNILSMLLPLLILAMGQTIVMITGGIDLSVTAIVAVTSVAGAAVMTSDNGLLGGSCAAIPTGMASIPRHSAKQGKHNTEVEHDEESRAVGLPQGTPYSM